MKRALLVGIDTYDQFSSLRGCVNDVNALSPLLARHEDASLNFECRSLTSDTNRITIDQLRDAMNALLAPGADVALFYFAGHGCSSTTGDDVTLVAMDGSRASPGVKASELLAAVTSSSVREIVIILDCCFSGGAGGLPQLGTASAHLRSGLSILTASRADQTSAETMTGRGLFSTYLEGALDGGAADVLGRVTLAGLYAYLSESFGAWEQRPTLKANIDRLHELRLCKPWVPLEKLRRLPKLFPTLTHVLPLDPSYEPTEEPHDVEHEQDFDLLQKYRAAKLVEPVDEDHLYFAAMHSTGCRLTALGQHYRNMAEEDRL